MCAAREPRRFNGLCDTCCELGHLSCDCLLQRDRIYSDVPTLSSPSQNNRSGRGGTGSDLPISSRDLRHSTVVVIVIVRNRSCDTTAAATVQHCRSSSSQPPAPSLALAGTRGTTAATVQRRSSSQAPAPSLALAGTRGTTAVTVQRRSSSQAPATSLALAGSRGTLDSRPPVNAGLADNIAQGQAQRDVGVDDRAEQQRPSTEVDYHDRPLSEVFGPPESVEHQRATTEMDCHGGPVSEVSGPPKATASLARGGLPLQARHQ